MASIDPQAASSLLKALLQPWHKAVEDPAQAQQEVLHRLLQGYAQTDYGAQHGAAHIDNVQDYRQAFPVATYEDYKPLIERVMAGEVGLLPISCSCPSCTPSPSVSGLFGSVPNSLSARSVRPSPSLSAARATAVSVACPATNTAWAVAVPALR